MTFVRDTSRGDQPAFIEGSLVGLIQCISIGHHPGESEHFETLVVPEVFALPLGPSWILPARRFQAAGVNTPSSSTQINPAETA